MIQNERVKLAMLQSLQEIEARKLHEQNFIEFIKSLNLDEKLERLRAARNDQQHDHDNGE